MQDKEQVLADVRSIISEQLGTQIDKVLSSGNSCSLGFPCICY